MKFGTITKCDFQSAKVIELNCDLDNIQTFTEKTCKCVAWRNPMPCGVSCSTLLFGFETRLQLALAGDSIAWPVPAFVSAITKNCEKKLINGWN